MNGEKGKLICVWPETHTSLHHSTPALRHHVPPVLRGPESRCQSVPYLPPMAADPCCLPTELNHSVPLQATPLIDLSRGDASANVDSTRREGAARATGGGRLVEAPENNTPLRFPWHEKQSRPPAPATEQTSAKLVSDSNPKARRASRKPVEWHGTKQLVFFFSFVSALFACPQENLNSSCPHLSHAAWILNLENSDSREALLLLKTPFPKQWFPNTWLFTMASFSNVYKS